MILTDQLMLDVLRSITMVSGELCVTLSLTEAMHKSPATCSDLGHTVFVLLDL